MALAARCRGRARTRPACVSTSADGHDGRLVDTGEEALRVPSDHRSGRLPDSRRCSGMTALPKSRPSARHAEMVQPILMLTAAAPGTSSGIEAGADDYRRSRSSCPSSSRA
jgi:hypothetical protein